jgi:hypothetical protein
MARLSKRIQQKNKKPAPPPKVKPGRDIMIILLIILTFSILAFGWQILGTIDIIMYSMLGVSLVCSYVHRHAELPENVHLWLERICQACMGLAFIFFLYVAYLQFTA